MKNNRVIKVLLALMSLSVPVAQADGVKVSGFADAQYSWAKGSGTASSTGVSVVDGAVYLSKELDGGSAAVDIPFAAALLTAGTFSIATGKAQAYVHYKYKQGYFWRLGQYDTLFGVDGNDAIDNTFTTQGLSYAALPVVHAGVMMGYDFSDAMSLSGYASAPNNATTLVSGFNPDFGFHFNWKGDGMKAALGTLFNNDSTGTQVASELKAGMSMGDIGVDASVLVGKPKTGSTGVGVLGQVTNKYNDWMGVAARVEFGSKLAADSQLQVAAGPVFWMTKDLTVKADYWLTNTTPLPGASAVTGHAVNMAAQYRL